VVTAPSGFGKTTLVRSWAESLPDRERRVLWLALDADVATRQDFWRGVAAAAVRRDELDPDADDRLSRGIATDDPVPTIARFLNARGSTLLLVDGYERLRSLTRQIDDDVIRLLAAVPGLEVVVTTRAPTRLADDVRVMRGMARAIGDGDLRFTADEIGQLVAIHAPHAAADAIELIARETRGYPLGVRAAIHALGRVERMPSVGSRAWKRLVSEDLESQLADPALVGFVLDTSVPPYFDRGLARELTGLDDVDEALADLSWHGFGRWIPSEREAVAYQYVESVREVFSARLRADRPERYRRNAGLAAVWLHRNDDTDQALALAIGAGHYGLVSKICGTIVAGNPHFYLTDRLERILRTVPRARLPQYPVLAFILGMIHSANPATQGSAAEYLRIAARPAKSPGRLKPHDEFAQYVRREVSLRYLGRGQEAGAVAVEGIEFLDSMSAAERDALGEFPALALSLFAYSAFQAGEVDTASAAVDRAATAANSAWWRNYSLGFALAIHGLNGNHRVAEAAEAATANETALPDRLRLSPHVLAALGKAALRLDEFDFDGALDQLESAVPETEADDTWPLVTWVAMHARLGLGDAGAEAHRIEEALATMPRIGVGANLGTAAVLNALAVLWLADGRPDKGRPLLRSDLACRGQLAPARLLYGLVGSDPALAVRSVSDLLAERGHTVRSATAVETLGAAAALRAGNDNVALELLGRAAARYGLVGVRAQLLYVPADDLAALRALAGTAGNTTCEDYLAGDVVAPISAVEAAPVMLTRRELEVLRAWATHRTRAEVANALFVSANTVSSQLKSAYRKLGVSTKDAAIQRALELDLLPRPPR